MFYKKAIIQQQFPEFLKGKFIRLETQEISHVNSSFSTLIETCTYQPSSCKLPLLNFHAIMQTHFLTFTLLNSHGNLCKFPLFPQPSSSSLTSQLSCCHTNSHLSFFEPLFHHYACIKINSPKILLIFQIFGTNASSSRSLSYGTSRKPWSLGFR